MRPDVDDVIGNLDHVRIVLDDDDRVALVAQLLEQLVETMDVARVQADARLVEDVHHVHEAAAEVLDHPDPLRFAAGQRVGLPIQGEVLEADVDHVLQALDERGQDRRRHRARDLAQEGHQLANLHGRELGDVTAADLRAERRLAQTGALAQRARPRPEVRLDRLPGPLRQQLDVAADVAALDLGDDPQIRDVDRAVAELHLELAPLAVEQQVHLLLREVLQLLVDVEEARGRVGEMLPGGEERHLHRPFLERLRQVDEVVRGDADLLAETAALGAHALRVVERECVGVAGVRLADPREQQPQQRVDVGHRPDRGVRAAPQALLVDDDRHAQVLDRVRFRRRVARQEVADEQAEVLVQLPLRFGGDRIEDDRRLARTGHAGEDRDLPLGNPQRHVLQVVLACAADLDELVHARLDGCSVPQAKLYTRPPAASTRTHFRWRYGGRAGDPLRPRQAGRSRNALIFERFAASENRGVAQ